MNQARKLIDRLITKSWITTLVLTYILCYCLLYSYNLRQMTKKKVACSSLSSEREINCLVGFVNFQTRKLQSIHLVLNIKFYSQNCGQENGSIGNTNETL